MELRKPPSQPRNPARKTSNGVLSHRLFFKGSRSTKKSIGFLFVVTSNLLIPAASNVLFPVPVTEGR